MTVEVTGEYERRLWKERGTKPAALSLQALAWRAADHIWLRPNDRLSIEVRRRWC